MSAAFDIKDKVAIVTGASRGIGLAIAQQFAESGVKVIISSRKQESLDNVAAELGQQGLEVLPVAAHNGDKEALKSLVDQTVEAYGTVDILVNNAATNPHFGTLLEAEDSMWQKTLEVNLLGNFWLTKFVVQIMRDQNKGGKIINVASVNGLRPGSFQGIYSVTKAGIINMTQTLAMELAAENIQVNAIAPGLIKTQFARAIWQNETIHDSILNRTPAGRIGEPDDVAGIAHYLAAPASDFTTGQVFIIDGGLSVPIL